jgi:RND superfamily putative drug exporter
MKINPESLARASSRHAGRTVWIWAVILVLGFGASFALLSSALTTDFDFSNSPEAKQAKTILEQEQLEQDVIPETFVMTGGDGAVSDPAFQDQVNAALNDLRALGQEVVTTVPASYPLPADQQKDPQVAALGPIDSQDGTAVLFTVILAGDSDETATHVEQLNEIKDRYTSGDTTMYMLGEPTSTDDFKKISEEDLQKGESIGIFVAIVVLIVVFAAILAGVTPIIMGIFAIGVAFGLVGLLGQLWHFTFFAPNLISMMGLAVGIDYSLFIVSRYREERARGRDTLDAIGMSGASANRAVFFSGLTVILALAGMLLIPLTIFRGLAGGAIIVVAVSLALSMTLLPALLALFGKKAEPLGEWINWPWKSLIGNVLVLLLFFAAAAVGLGIPVVLGAPPSVGALTGLAAAVIFLVFFTKAMRRGAPFARWLRREATVEHGRPGGFWDTVTRAVMARPWVWLILAASFMILLSVPFWAQAHPSDNGRGIKTGLSGISTIPDDVQTKQAFDVVVAEFPKAGQQSTADVVIPGPSTDPKVQQGIEQLTTAMANDPDFGAPTPPQTSADGAYTLVRFPNAGAATDAQSEAAVDAISRVRDQYVPQAFGADSGVLVGGDSAFVKDFFDISARYTPLIILLVLGLSFLLLTVVFRSIVVPAKAIVMNLLSVGAAYGLIVLIFQKGGPSWAHSIANAFGFAQVDAIEAWLPLFLFSILFGLSMDYQVFLISRIREEYDKSGDNSEAVAFGLRTTGGIITGAAIIMVAVFAGFASGRLTSLEQMGFGLAIAVFLDATIVRSILVPSAMKLLGDRNWYLPGWLQWLPKVDVEGHAAAERVTIPDTPAELVEAHEPRD